MATLTFCGATQEVTGSCYLLESPSLGQALLECGMHQGGDVIENIQGGSFDFDPASIDFVILSHAHLDHSGRLPELVHNGFSGPIYCTHATKELLHILLEDSWGLYQRDLDYKNRRRGRRGQPPLSSKYSQQDMRKVLKLCESMPYEKVKELSPDAQLCFYDAGHILGSAIVEVKVIEKGENKLLVFSGDLGNKDSVLMNDPSMLTNADLLLMEGTYGNRNHRDMDNTLVELSTILTEAKKRGGNVMIPSFAVGRTQEILYHLGCLYHKGELDGWHVFLDSPMAIEVTKVYDHWLNIMDDEDVRCLTEVDRSSLEKFIPTLKLCVSTEESMAINRINQGAIIIAGSGMCTGGRIRHHFKHRIWHENNTIIFVGFQARGTLGRCLVDGQKHIRIFSEEYFVKANIETLGGFSAHAGQTELIQWLLNFNPVPRVVLIHGEAQALEDLSKKVWDDHQIKTEIPSKGSCIAF